MPKSFRIFTVGCKVNQYESQAIKEGFLKNGHKELDENGPADVFIINTCTVTAKADRDSRRFIHYSHRINPNAKIIVTGCFVEKDEDDIRAIPGVTQIVKNSEKYRILDFVIKGRPIYTPGVKWSKTQLHPRGVNWYTPLEISDFHGRTRAFVKVQDGCNNFCSYCKVPLVRGRSRSRDSGSILDEVTRLVNKGFKEIVLCGICLGEWGRDLLDKPELADLVDKIDSISGDFRIRLSSIGPNLVSGRLIKKMAESGRLCRHLHIPLQSGDDRILKLMNRAYTAKDFITLVEKIRKTAPHFSLTTDVLAGFPGEGRRNFSNTVKVLKHLRPSRLHVFSYSRRKGTRAYDYGPPAHIDETKYRTSILRGLGEEFSYRYRRSFLNKTTRVIVEDKPDKSTRLLTGYTDTYIRTLIDGPASLFSQMVPAKVIKVDKKSTFSIPL